MSIPLDVTTLSFMSLLIFSLMSALLLLMWLGDRKETALLFWIGGYLLVSLGLIGLLLRGAIPDFVSIVLANTVIVTGLVLAGWGNQYFFRQKPYYGLGAALIAVTAFGLTVFAGPGEENFLIRVIVVSTALTLISLACALSLARRLPPSMWPAQGLAILSFLALAVFYGLRLYFALRHSMPQGLFASGHLSILTYLLPTASSVLTAFAWILLVNQRLRLRLLETHQIDQRTGALSRDSLAETGDAEISRCRRHGNMLSVLMLDIDHFRRINERHGHASGNAWLRHLVTVTRGVLRQEDRIGRLAGDEFCVILPQTDPHGAALLAERIRLAIENTPLPLGRPTMPGNSGTIVPATVSIGVAALEPNDIAPDWERLTAAADMALHDAKRLGRNQVAISTPETALRLSTNF